MTEIKILEGKYEVDINIERGTRLNRIIVEGYSDMMPCISDITKIIHQVQNEGEQENLADLFYKQARIDICDSGLKLDWCFLKKKFLSVQRFVLLDICGSFIMFNLFNLARLLVYLEVGNFVSNSMWEG